jgi:hypothetical protein
MRVALGASAVPVRRVWRSRLGGPGSRCGKSRCQDRSRRCGRHPWPPPCGPATPERCGGWRSCHELGRPCGRSMQERAGQRPDEERTDRADHRCRRRGRGHPGGMAAGAGAAAPAEPREHEPVTEPMSSRAALMPGVGSPARRMLSGDIRPLGRVAGWRAAPAVAPRASRSRPGSPSGGRRGRRPRVGHGRRPRA